MDSVHAVADNANRLARLTAELQSLHFLSPKAHRTIAPMDGIAAAQALTPTNRSDVLAAVLEIISRREAKLTPQQVAYAAYSVAALQGLNRSEAALAAVEVSTLDEDENLAPLAEVLFFQGMDLAEAKALVVDTAERLPRVSAKALRQAFWHFQQLQDSSRQLVRSRIMDDFEGGPAFSAYRDAQAFQGLQVATAHAISAGAEAQQMLSYHMASGYSYKQALKLLGAEGNITEELTLAGQRLTEQLAVPAVQSVDSSWFQSTGHPEPLLAWEDLHAALWLLTENEFRPGRAAHSTARETECHQLQGNRFRVRGATPGADGPEERFVVDT